MKTIHVRSRVGSDGVLNLNVSTGIKDSELDVLIIVDQPNRLAQPSTPEQWAQFVKTTAGSITDPTFIRHEQGESEAREALS